LRLEACPLPARSDNCAPDCVGGEKATMRLVCGCVWGGTHERKGRRGKHLRTKPEAQMERALSIDLKTLPPNAPVSLSRVTAHSKAHAAAGTRTCANGCGLHEGSPTSPRHTHHSAHPSGPQHASTYRPLALRPPARHSTIHSTIPEKQFGGLSPQVIPKIC
jgi:hypothetical protein